jgi:hypothetical protein
MLVIDSYSVVWAFALMDPFPSSVAVSNYRRWNAYPIFCKNLFNWCPFLTVIQRVIDWLTNKRIILTGEQDEIGHYDYQDFRTEEERKLLLWTPV